MRVRQLLDNYRWSGGDTIKKADLGWAVYDTAGNLKTVRVQVASEARATPPTAPTADNAVMEKPVDEKRVLLDEANSLLAKIPTVDAERCVAFIQTYATEPKTELVRQLLTQRRIYIAQGGPLHTIDEINAEVAAMRRR